MGLSVSQQLAILLGLINHLYFHWFEPKSATLPLLLLAVQPLALLVVLGVPISYTSVPVVYFSFITSLCSSIVVYRISPWHPLAEFPGPMVNKISKVWGAWVSLGGSQHRVNKQLHDIYGPFAQTKYPSLTLTRLNPSWAPGVFPKGQYYAPRTDPSLPTRNLLTLEGEAHTNRRRIWNRGMNSKSIQEYEPFLTKRVAQLASRLETFTGSASVDISKWISFFTFDFMGDMAFGGGFEMLRDGGDQDGLWTLVEKSAKTVAVISHTPWLVPTLRDLPFASRSIVRLRKFAVACATSRIKAGSKVKDLWYHLTDEAEIGEMKPTLAESVSDGVLAIVAGADTTASALSSFLWCILSNPDIYRRVQAEVDSVYPDEESVSDTSKQGDLYLLTACLNETLRLFPPILTNGARQAKEGKLVADRFVPGGTQIYIPSYSIHRNPEYFSPSPEQFDPDRWLRPSTPDSVLNLTAFIPFSYGEANCVGKSLAWREMLLVSSTLIKKFNISFAADGFDSAIWPEKLQDYFVTSITYPLLVNLARR
ncbi:high nitrogen upregulated cytochrome P450 monooxygenase 2 [Mycena rebaudengoi]|nr:high nitrogen upregulated cytochrome P450 monooxygenase 2 [Mycena rebaudengoi]